MVHYFWAITKGLPSLRDTNPPCYECNSKPIRPSTSFGSSKCRSREQMTVDLLKFNKKIGFCCFYMWNVITTFSCKKVHKYYEFEQIYTHFNLNHRKTMMNWKRTTYKTHFGQIH